MLAAITKITLNDGKIKCTIVPPHGGTMVHFLTFILVLQVELSFNQS